MTDPEPRPRPQYGEYATPDQQREHIREPLPERVPLTPPDALPSSSPVWGGSAPAGVAERKGSQGDRWATIALLAWGAFVVITTAISLFDLPAAIPRSYEMMGIDGKFTNIAEGKTWGAIGATVLLVGYVITAWIAMRRVKAGKLAWWVTLVGAAVSFVLVGICMSIPLMNDPAFMNSVQNPPTP